jgi:hypothetical protein
LTIDECPVTKLYHSDHEGAVVWVMIMKKIKKRMKAEYDEELEGE